MYIHIVTKLASTGFRTDTTRGARTGEAAVDDGIKLLGDDSGVLIVTPGFFN